MVHRNSVTARILTGFLAACSLAVTGGWAAAERQPAKVERLSSEINQIIPQQATLERVATSFKWVEGPVWIKAGYLLFSEIPSNSIRKWTPGQGVTIFLQPSGYQGAAPYGGPEPGSNGLTVDHQGRLTVAGHAQRDIYRFETMNPHGEITILANAYRGKKLNSPNDLVYKSDGSLYFTDPPYGLRTQSDQDPHKELKINGVYRLRGALHQKPGSAPANGKLELVISDLPRPNGIAFSPDEKYLYVNNSEPKKIWMRYSVKPDGLVDEPKLIFDATSDTREGAPDGLKVDRNGNLYSAGPGGVWIFSAAGKHIGTIDMPEKVGNLAWGGEDMTTLYIAASSSIYRIRLSATGQKPGS